MNILRGKDLEGKDGVTSGAEREGGY